MKYFFYFRRNMHCIKTAFICMCLFFISGLAPLLAQHDSTFYVSYADEITGRFYFSKKYTAFNLRNSNDNFNLRYRPNTTVNMGVGATYKWATLNLAYGFDFLNPERGQGDTDYLDLQVHAYGRKFTFDFLGSLYKGFFLSPRGKATSNNSYYVRPDMIILTTGLSAQYILNHNKFSYQAAFHQSEWQKRSAGSVLVGLETYIGSIRTDSTLVPANVNSSVAAQHIDKIKFYEFGPNVGYVHSFIIKQHFFITASAAVSFDYGKTIQESDLEQLKYSGFSPNLFLKAFWGYNSENWAISFVYINNGVNLSASNDPGRRIALNTGNFRVNIVKRFSPGKKAKKVLKYIDDVEKRF